MPAGKRRRARHGPSVFMLAGLVAATALGACAGRNCSGSAGSTANPNDLAGCGGSVDRIYNELYTPGDPSWSQF